MIGRTDAEAEAPIFWPPDVKRRLTGKDLDARKDWRQGEKRATEDKMVVWHHCLNKHEFEQIPGDSKGQGGLVACHSWCSKQSDMSNQRISSAWLLDYSLTKNFISTITCIVDFSYFLKSKVKHFCLTKMKKETLKLIMWLLFF